MEELKYISRRQNPLKGIPEKEIDELFGIIVKYFGNEWLIKENTHPLSKLWNRKDFIATSELFTLAYAMKYLKDIDEHWLRHQINIIKVGKDNNRKGAFFEIIGLGLFCAKNNVRPAEANRPGFDATLIINSFKNVRLSLKNYGLSQHFEIFTRNSTSIEKKIKELLKINKIGPVHIFISHMHKCPEKKEWTILNNYIEAIFRSYKDTSNKYFVVNDEWAVFFSELGGVEDNFHESYQSYTLIVASPYHKNEEKNLFDKLDEACYNLTKHSKIEDDNVKNSIFIHLPVTASFNSCKKWVHTYFENNSDKPISCVILYQPSIVTDPNTNQTHIDHCVTFINKSEEFANWLNKENYTPTIEIPVGQISSEPAVIKLFADKTEKEIVEGNYLYQKGNHYIKAERDAKGDLSGLISKLSSGIHQHSVFKPFPNQKEIVFSGHFPPTDDLLII